MSEMNNCPTYDFAAALRGEELKEVERLAPGPDRPTYDFAAALRGEELKETGRLTPLQEWNQFADDQRNADLGEWYKKLQAGEPIEDWQKQALKDFNIWGGDSPPSAAEAEEPADEPDEEEVEGQVKSGLSKFLESVPWKRIVLEGTTIIPPMVFGGLLGYLDPETARNISLATGTAGIGLAFTSMAAAMAERILPAHVRAGLLGRALVGAKVAGMYGGNVFLSAAIGTHVGAGIREGIEVLHAAQPVVTGGGEGAMVDHPKPVDASIGQAGGLPPEDGGAGAIINPPAEVPGQAGNLPGGGESGALPPGEFGQPPQSPEIDVQKIVDSLPKHVGVAQLPENQQLGASHWRLAEAWSKPLANTFGLSDSARTFFTDAVKDLTQDQGNVRMDTIVNYDKRQIGDYLAEAVARLKETNPAGWQVKVPKDDLERLTKIAEFLKNSK